MLLGRDGERHSLTRLLSEARSGTSGVLAIVGEPGIGKSALLDEARDAAAGFTVLRARGVESEAEVPFGGLLELLRPALGRLPDIPAPQADALGAALALQPGRTGERFAVGAATLSLLAAEADEAPVLVLVDDAQWLDGSSATALHFAFRRLVADPIAVLLSVRDGEPSLVDGTDLPVLRLGGLDRAAAATLLEQASGAPLDPDVQERLYLATAGNPLALLQLAGEAPRLGDPTQAGPIPISTSIADAFARRADALGEQARAVLLVAAAAETHELGVIARAATSLGLDVDALREAEDAALVRLEESSVRFTHPLARSAIYARATPQERRDAHRALVAALPDRDADRRAWHLAAATLGPDESTAEALAQAGMRARERSAYSVASAAFARGARLHPLVERQAALLYDAADAAWRAGAAEACTTLLQQAEAAVTDPALAARVSHRRGHVLARSGRVRDGYETLVRAAAGIDDTEPGLAVTILADAVDSMFPAGDGPRMLEAAQHAVALAGLDGSERAMVFAAIAHGMALVFAGDGAVGAAEFRRAVDLIEATDAAHDDPELAALAAMGPLYLREATYGRDLIDRGLEVVRRHAAVGILPRLLHRVARDEAASDRWPAAQAHYTEAVALARETGQLVDLGGGLAGLAALESRLGQERSCRAHATEALTLCAELGLTIYEIWTRIGLGELELVLGNASAAAEEFERQAAALAAAGIADPDLSPAPELVDVYLRLGDAERAAGHAAAFVDQARAKGQPWALARAERALALLGGDDSDLHFARALELHDETPDLFEAARTRLGWGARLRRDRRRVESRQQLRAAIDVFDQLGAEPWAALAGVELAATGETARRRSPHTLGDLTAQELQIALILASGKTTREAAAALFLSPKTVEYHLRHVYRKLDIGSRDELARAMGGV